MKKIFKIMSLLIIGLALTGCGNNKVAESQASDKIKIAVSIVPQSTFVEKVGGEHVEVVTMIPPGASPENYQVSPKDMTSLSDAKLYFAIGVNAENTIVSRLEELNSEIKTISLDKVVANVYPDRFFEDKHEDESNEEHSNEAEEHEGHSHIGRDPHIWLSPKRVIVMVESIRDELIAVDAENKALYTENAANYIEELKNVEQEVLDAFTDIENKSFIMYHPAFGYFADDFGLNMVEIEEDGKQASAARIKTVIDFAKVNNIHYIFYQEEFDSQQAETIAHEIGGAAVKVAPLSPDYIQNIKAIAESIKSVEK